MTRAYTLFPALGSSRPTASFSGINMAFEAGFQSSKQLSRHPCSEEGVEAWFKATGCAVVYCGLFGFCFMFDGVFSHKRYLY